MNTHLASYYLQRIGFPVRNRRLLLFDLPLPTAPRSAADGDWQVRQLSSDDIRRLDYPGGWLTRDVAFDRAKSRRCTVVGAVRGSTLGAYCWVEADYADLAFFDLRVQLGPGTWYLSHVYTSPEHRGTGIGRAVVGVAGELAMAQQCRRLVAVCDPNNTPVIRLFTSLGWHAGDSMHYLRVGPVARTVRRTTATGRRTVYWGGAKLEQEFFEARQIL